MMDREAPRATLSEPRELGYSKEEMAAGHLLNEEAEALRAEIRHSLPYGQDWLVTPHQLLGGDSPEERILAGDLEAVRNLLDSILYVGVL